MIDVVNDRRDRILSEAAAEDDLIEDVENEDSNGCSERALHICQPQGCIGQRQGSDQPCDHCKGGGTKHSVSEMAEPIAHWMGFLLSGNTRKIALDR